MFGSPSSQCDTVQLPNPQFNESSINTEQEFSNHSITYDLDAMSADCQGRVAAIQALIDLDSSAVEPVSQSMDAYNTLPQSTQVTQKSGKRACNCAKSHCLKLYCECFAKGQPCRGCNCSNCMNNPQFDDERQKAIKLTLDRNPLAFYPKIGSSERRHSKGCNCKRSGCLKNYCECYEAKISCSDLCRCRGCRNYVNFGQPAGFPHAGPRSHGRKNENESLMEHYQVYAFDENPAIHINKTQSLFTACITPEVVEVSCSCMLAQLFEAEQHNQSDSSQEHAVLIEFGRCLDHILDSVNKLRNYQHPPPNYNNNTAHSSTIPLHMDALPRAAENALTCGYPPVQAVSQSQDPSLDLNYRQQGEYIGMPIQCPYPAHPIGTNAFESTDQPQLSHLGYPIAVERHMAPIAHQNSLPVPFACPNSPTPMTTIRRHNSLQISDLSEAMRSDPTNGPAFTAHYGGTTSPPQNSLMTTCFPDHHFLPSSHGNLTTEEDENAVAASSTSCFARLSSEADLAAAALNAEISISAGSGDVMSSSSYVPFDLNPPEY